MRSATKREIRPSIEALKRDDAIRLRDGRRRDLRKSDVG